MFTVYKWHPHSFHVLRVNFVICRIHKVAVVHYHIMSVIATPYCVYVCVRCPPV